jgi:hypothetical protein
MTLRELLRDVLAQRKWSTSGIPATAGKPNSSNKFVPCIIYLAERAN